jgi:predicted nucleic acid-binding protein
MALMLIDTDILIDAARSITPALDRLEQEEQSSTLAISVITQMELTIGCRNRGELQQLNNFLQRYQRISFSEPISTQAIELMTVYYLSHNLLIADALIAATAITLNVPLLSKNQRDYRFIEGLSLLPYP